MRWRIAWCVALVAALGVWGLVSLYRELEPQPAQASAAASMGAHGIKQPVVDGDLVFIDDQRITDLSSATALTVPDGTRAAWIFVEAQNVRWRHGTPTAAIGAQISAGGNLWTTASLDSLQFIEEGSGAILFVNYYKY